MKQAQNNQPLRVTLSIGIILPRTMTVVIAVIPFVTLVLLLLPNIFVQGFVPPLEARAIASAHSNAAGTTNLPTTSTLEVSGFFEEVAASASTTTTNDAVFGFDPAPAALTASDIWALRIGSGLVTYFGFVFATDRPRGQLGVPLASSGNDNDNDNSAVNMDACLRVGPSTVPGAGLGLFAARSMPKGTLLGTYPGVLIPLAQHSASAKLRECPACASYIWRFTDNRYVIDPTDHGDGSLGAMCKGGNPSQPLSVAFFNILSNLGLYKGVSTALCRINEPPKGRDVNVVTEEDLESRTVAFALERDVFAGEELHIDYGLTYDRSGYGNPGSGM